MKPGLTGQAAKIDRLQTRLRQALTRLRAFLLPQALAKWDANANDSKPDIQEVHKNWSEGYEDDIQRQCEEGPYDDSE